MQFFVSGSMCGEWIIFRRESKVENYLKCENRMRLFSQSPTIFALIFSDEKVIISKFYIRELFY